MKNPEPAEPETIERWTAQRKAAIILEVLKGQISVPEAARKYGFTQGEYRKWADEFMRSKSTARASKPSIAPKSAGCRPRSANW